jgi:hypothetical protein
LPGTCKAPQGGGGQLRRPARSPRPRRGAAPDGRARLGHRQLHPEGRRRPPPPRFQDALGLFLRLVNIGDTKSLACHPASTTHRQLDAGELAKAGVSEGMVRLSVGIEHIDDLLADLEQALGKV